MYRAIRDYYDAAFATQRWTFDGENPSTVVRPDLATHELAVQRTSQAFKAGEELWVRFRTALNLLERPSRGNNGGKQGDFAQGVRLMRVAFAELSHLLSDCEPPLLFFSLVQVMMLFRESSARDFRSVETQLLKHLHDLTSTATGAPRHPTALLWRILWAGNRGVLRNRYQLCMCAAVAIEKFSQYIGYSHLWTVELSNFSIYTLHAAGTGDPEDKTTRFRNLLQQLETLETYDARHLNVVCCWANHYWLHGKQGNVEMLEEAITLLEGVLRDPRKRQAVEEHADPGFNVYSLLTSIYDRLGRWDVAEQRIRSAIKLAERDWLTTGGDGDLFEGLNRLEIVLRAQGKIDEADAAQQERKRLVKESLERVGEKEDCA